MGNTKGNKKTKHISTKAKKAAAKKTSNEIRKMTNTEMNLQLFGSKNREDEDEERRNEDSGDNESGEDEGGDNEGGDNESSEDEDEEAIYTEVQDQKQLLDKYKRQIKTLANELNAYKEDNARLQRIDNARRTKMKELLDQIQDLKNERDLSLQQSASLETMVADTYNRVGKYVKDSIFHYKKFVNDDEDLNDITGDESVGKRTMDHFEIPANRRVAWWNTYKKAAGETVATQRSSVSSSIKRELKGTSQNV